MALSSVPSSFSSSPVKATPGDGFTPVEQVLTLPTKPWAPNVDYEESKIGYLEPGPRNIVMTGRIVNLYNVPKPSKRARSSQGFLKIMLADDTGVVTVRLWYADAEYSLRLGQLVTVWTVHVSVESGNMTLAPKSAPMFTSIFPEGERNCFLKVQENGNEENMCREPLAPASGQGVAGLMTLRNFMDGGWEAGGCKVLVCVKGVGTKTAFTKKDGTTSRLTTTDIFDDTASALLTLYGYVCASSTSWSPNHTILLISNPGYRSGKLSLTANTQLHIDPDLPDARYLRVHARRRIQHEHVNPPFPADVFDANTAENAAVRVLFKLSEIDEFVRNNPQEKVMGYISVIVTELHIVTHWKRNMLMSAQCCGIPIFDNALTAKCKRCETEHVLRISPGILGPFVDETAHIASGKLLFSDAAWEQLLGRTAAQLVASPLNVLQYLEQRMLFLRLTLGFGMFLDDGGSDEAGLGPGMSRLVIWCVKG